VFREPLTRVKGFRIGRIIAGVLFIEVVLHGRRRREVRRQQAPRIRTRFRRVTRTTWPKQVPT
jgi:hypothetical protein